MSIRALQEYTRFAKYAKYLPEKNRRETWPEQILRVFNMHRKKFKNKLDVLEFYIAQAEKAVLKKEILGSQRALQFGGEPILEKNARLYNCFSVETEFITDRGIKSFKDFNNGDIIKVLTHTGQWKDALVSNFGKQPLNKITFTKGATRSPFEVFATSDHEWILNNGSRTTSLQPEQLLSTQPNIFDEFNYDYAFPFEKLYWCYGYVYGDGTRVKYRGKYAYSMVRLCNKDARFINRFEEMGFKSSSPCSINGDYIAYTGSYLKTAPDPTKDSPELIRAFVHGFLQADGEKNSNYLKSNHASRYVSIQQTSQEHRKFIRECFPIAGVYIISETPVTHTTNYGKCDSVSFRLSTNMSGSSPRWRCQSIEKYIQDEVWCLEVEDDHSFVMPNGLVTGNCTVSYIDRPRFFQEIMYVLLCGCGAGFSVQKHHIEKLPKVQSVDPKEKLVYKIPDSVEGWSDAIGVLVSSYFEKNVPIRGYKGKTVVFDYSDIRLEGTPISSGGKAPGPDGLCKSIEKIRNILDKATEDGSRQLKSIEVYDICMHISDSVLSGGIRRSATICLFSPEDKDMREAKIGSWFHNNPQRARSNNSAILIREDTTRETFTELMKSVKHFGEPGFVWTEHKDIIYNPCFDRNTRLSTKNGLIKITDLMNQPNTLICDNRAGKEDELILDNIGVSQYTATKAQLTNINVPVYKLSTKHGNEVLCTEYHQFPTLEGRKMLKDLEIGDTLLLQNDEGCWGNIGTYNQGLIIGMIQGDGTFYNNNAYINVWEDDFDVCDQLLETVNEEVLDISTTYGEIGWQEYQSKHYGKKIHRTLSSVRLYTLLRDKLNIEVPESIKKEVPECVFGGTREMVRGYLHGLIFADGSVTLMKGYKKNADTLEVQICQTNKDTLLGVQQLLLNFGIVSRVRKLYDNKKSMLPDGKGGEKEYQCNACYRLEINRPNSIKLFDTIGLYGRKHKILEELIEQRGKDCCKPERYQTCVAKIEYIKHDDVFCLTQPKTNTVIANGIVVGQCSEIGMYAYEEETGQTGWQMCNLCEINMKKAITEEKFIEQCESAAILGTLQAAYTDFPYLGEITKKIVEREALLGVSMTGMMDNPDIAFDERIQRRGAKKILEVNETISKIIGTNPCARATCVKPAGNSSCMLGTASGIHPHHATRYFRHVQENKNEPALAFFMQYNPTACEESVWSSNNTDVVIKFLCEVPDGAKTKNHVDAISLLELVRSTQQNWVEYGTRKESCVLPMLRHNVSNTCTVMPHEWHEVEKYIYLNRRYFAGISLLPMSGDKDYAQAPFTAVFTPNELVKEYGDGAMFASGLIVDGLRCFNDNLWRACDAILDIGLIPLKVYEEEWKAYFIYGDQCDIFRYNSSHKGIVEMPGFLFKSQQDWIRRARQFADRYFDEDIRKMTYCLKDVRNWKVWCDLKREYKDVPWEDFQEMDDNTKQIEVLACGGGKCDLI